MSPAGGVRLEAAPSEIRLCCGSGCVAEGAMDVLEALRSGAAEASLEVEVRSRLGYVGCRGFCSQGPLLHLPGPDVLYCRVTVDDVEEILSRTVGRGEIVERLLYEDPVTGVRCRGLADNPFFRGQDRQVMDRCGVVDPEDLEHAVSLGAYENLRQALRAGDPSLVIDRVKRSGLLERAGAGFPVGLKWAVVAESPGDPKYVVGNGDDGDPGLTAGRVLLEGDPHRVLEGMVIAAWAVGAGEGRLYLRSEHALAVARAERAVAQARRAGFLGLGVCGSDFDFSVEICENGGAMMGGEETAILNVIQGARGAARPRPPFPAVSGLWGRPTLINSIETLANVPLIVGEAAQDEPRAGRTRIVGLSGRVRRPGVAEVPLGTPVSEVVDAIGGGCCEGELSAVHIGGVGGATLRPDQLATGLDFSTLRACGARFSSGGLVVLGSGDCPVALTRYLVARCAEGSCGTCTPCRIGTQVLLNLLARIVSGEGDESDVGRLESLSRHIKRTAMCEHGRNAARSVLANLENFREAFSSHVAGEGCPGGDPLSFRGDLGYRRKDH